MDELKAKRKRVQTERDHLTKQSETLAEKAETAKQIATTRKYITESNSHRHSAKEKGIEIVELDKKIEDVMIRIKNIE